MSADSKTRLNVEEIAFVRAAILRYLEEHDFITNRLLRELTNIGYDQCIHVFGEMLRSGDLTKVGKASGTRYLLSKMKRRIS